ALPSGNQTTGTPVTFKWDVMVPTSVVTWPQANPPSRYYVAVTSIAGTAVDLPVGGLQSIEVRIVRNSDGREYDGANFVIAANLWLNTGQSASPWSYTI